MSYAAEFGLHSEHNYFFLKYNNLTAKAYGGGTAAIIIPYIIATAKTNVHEIQTLYGYSLGPGKWKFIPSAGIGMQFHKITYLPMERDEKETTENSTNIIVPFELSVTKHISEYSYLKLMVIGNLGKYKYGGIGFGLGFGK